MSEPVNDLQVLFPDREIEIAGEKLTVREFRYREGLQAAALARPFLAGLRELLTGAGEIEPEAVLALQAEHAAAWLELVALSCGKPVEWVANLPDKDAMALDGVFWEVNSPFFMRRLKWAAAFAAEARVVRSRSRKSSRTSSGPDTEATPVTSPDASPGDKSSVLTA